MRTSPRLSLCPQLLGVYYASCQTRRVWRNSSAQAWAAATHPPSPPHTHTSTVVHLFFGPTLSPCLMSHLNVPQSTLATRQCPVGASVCPAQAPGLVHCQWEAAPLVGWGSDVVVGRAQPWLRDPEPEAGPQASQTLAGTWIATAARSQRLALPVTSSPLVVQPKEWAAAQCLPVQLRLGLPVPHPPPARAPPQHWRVVPSQAPHLGLPIACRGGHSVGVMLHGWSRSRFVLRTRLRRWCW